MDSIDCLLAAAAITSRVEDRIFSLFSCWECANHICDRMLAGLFDYHILSDTITLRIRSSVNWLLPEMPLKITASPSFSIDPDAEAVLLETCRLSRSLLRRRFFEGGACEDCPPWESCIIWRSSLSWGACWYWEGWSPWHSGQYQGPFGIRYCNFLISIALQARIVLSLPWLLDCGNFDGTQHGKFRNKCVYCRSWNDSLCTRHRVHHRPDEFLIDLFGHVRAAFEDEGGIWLTLPMSKALVCRYSNKSFIPPIMVFLLLRGSHCSLSPSKSELCQNSPENGKNCGPALIERTISALRNLKTASNMSYST